MKYHCSTSVVYPKNRATMKVTAAAILVGAMIFGGCAEGKGGKGGKAGNKAGTSIKYGSQYNGTEPHNIGAALIGVDLPKLRPYGEYPIDVWPFLVRNTATGCNK